VPARAQPPPGHDDVAGLAVLPVHHASGVLPFHDASPGTAGAEQQSVAEQKWLWNGVRVQVCEFRVAVAEMPSWSAKCLISWTYSGRFLLST
jgi:hypothetical protein